MGSAFRIDTWSEFASFQHYFNEHKVEVVSHDLVNGVINIHLNTGEQFNIPGDVWNDKEKIQVRDYLSSLSQGLFNDLKSKRLIFGKMNLDNIVSCEVNGTSVEIFTEHNGVIASRVIPYEPWILCNRKIDYDWQSLDGNLYYKYIKRFTDADDYRSNLAKLRKYDLFTIYDQKEAAMVSEGFTYYRGMKVKDVSILTFDIEATGLAHNDDSRVLIISNTYRNQGTVERKLFCYDEYGSDAELFDAWCAWVQEKNPSIIAGHNIYSYDLPYMQFCASKAGTTLALGRDGSDIRFATKTSKFRKDGSQFYDYYKAYIYGREIVDTMFLSIRYDFARKYENYRLKSIIAHEGLEVAGRQHYDAGSINENYKDPVEWEKIKKYALHDADDALALYDLMVAAYFYLTPSIPKSFQSMMTSASGSQINSFLMRSYFQDGHSLPKASPEVPFEGAISLGNPGVYRNVFKVDVSSLYPSIMLQYEVYDKDKDPKAHFLKMVDYFTKERLNNKKLAKETEDRYYKDLQEAQKIIINSAYGMMGADGLLFNSPSNASFVTMKGREILQTSIDWANSFGFKIVNADTDSIAICQEDGREISENERVEILSLINKLYPSKIRFEDDGYYPSVIVIKAKNYCLWDGKKRKIKGSALKASMKEKALKEFINQTIDNLLFDNKDGILMDYHQYVREIVNLKDITRWSSKKTITESVLNPERTNEQKVLDAITDSDYSMGDKAYFYFDKDNNLKLQEHWNGDHNIDKLLEKLWKTLNVFETVLDMTQYPKYWQVRKKKLLEELLQTDNKGDTVLSGVQI